MSLFLLAKLLVIEPIIQQKGFESDFCYAAPLLISGPEKVLKSCASQSHKAIKVYCYLITLTLIFWNYKERKLP